MEAGRVSVVAGDLDALGVPLVAEVISSPPGESPRAISTTPAQPLLLADQLETLPATFATWTAPVAASKSTSTRYREVL